MSRIGRRAWLRGAGGVALALPFLEGLAPRRAEAGGESVVEPFAIFVRQANGVAAEQKTLEMGLEPERFWPRDHGPLTPENVEGRAIGELGSHLHRLLVVSNVNMRDYSYGDPHARGAMQALTARGPVVVGAGAESEADGESLDHRIGRELGRDGRDSLFLYAGQLGGHLGGPCISYRDSGKRRAAIHDPLAAYQTMMGLDTEQLDEIIARQKSINDLVRGQLQSLTQSATLSGDDRRRLELHLQSVRDLENSLTCNLSEDQLAKLEGGRAGYDSDDGDAVLGAVKSHMHVAALAVACGFTRSVAIQVGDGNDGTTRYRDLDRGEAMENYHYVSHRRTSHDTTGKIIPDADLLHHMVDVQFARAFAYLLDLLAAYELPDGQRLADCGIACWYNDHANGPAHSEQNVPWVIGGSAGGHLAQGQYLALGGGEYELNHARLLNTLGAAVGLRNAAGEPIDDFGDPELPRSILSELLA